MGLTSKEMFPDPTSPVAKFIVLDWYKVDSGIGLLYRPARLHSLAGRYNKLMPESTISPIQELGIRLQELSYFIRKFEFNTMLLFFLILVKCFAPSGLYI
jgi:hypothetical protein